MQIPNHWSSIGIEYMIFNWRDEEITRISISAELCEQIYEFIENCLKGHESVIIHGIGTQSTSFLVALVYLMQRFKWTFHKSFEYLQLKRPVLQISEHISMLCQGLEAHLMMKYGRLSDDWAPLGPEASQEEHLAHNTHTNALLGHHVFEEAKTQREKKEELEPEKPKKGIFWKDSKDGNELREIIPQLEMEKCTNPRDLTVVKAHHGEKEVKPIVKRGMPTYATTNSQMFHTEKLQYFPTPAPDPRAERSKMIASYSGKDSSGLFAKEDS